MAEIPIAVNDRFRSLTATGGQTVFSGDFPILDKVELTVTRVVAGVRTVLVLDTDYTVSGVGAANGFTVTLASGATAGHVYEIAGATKFERLSDYGFGAALPTPDLNADLDRAVMRDQELASGNALLDNTIALSKLKNLAAAGILGAALAGPVAAMTPAEVRNFAQVYSISDVTALINAAVEAIAQGAPVEIHRRSIFDFEVAGVKAKGDCTGVGAGTDDGPVIQAAFDWLAGGSYRELYFPWGYRFRVATACSCNFGGTSPTYYRGQSLIMHSPITPDALAFDAFTLHNAYDVTLSLKCYEGGKDADYNQADPTGKCQAFVLRGMRGPTFTVSGRNFAGRLLRIPPHLSLAGEPKMSFVRMPYFAHEAPNVGQSFYIDCGSDAFGHVDVCYCLYGKYGPKVINVSDQSWGRIAGGDNTATAGVNAGIHFKGPVSLWIGIFDSGDVSNGTVGDFSQNTATLLTIEDNTDVGLTHEAFHIHINKAFLNTAGTGLKLKNIATASADRPGITIDDVSTIRCQAFGIDIENVRSSKIGVHRSLADKQPLKISGIFTDCKVETAYRNSTDTAIEIAAGATIDGSLFNGFIREACTGNDGNPVVNIVDATGRITFENFTNYSDKGSFNWKLPANNRVYITGGGQSAIGSGGAVFDTNVAYLVEPGHLGWRSFNKNRTNILSGNASVTVAHDLPRTPNMCFATGEHAETAGLIVSADATNITITATAGAVTADRAVNWQAWLAEATR